VDPAKNRRVVSGGTAMALAKDQALLEIDKLYKEYCHNSNLEKRIDLFQKLLTVSEENGLETWAIFAQGMLFWLEKKSESASAKFGEAIAKEPAFAMAWNGNGNVLSDLGKKEEALAAYEKAIDLDAKIAAAWNGKGNVLFDLGKKEEGLAAFEQAIEVDPELAGPWNGRGLALFDLGKDEEALAAFEKAIGLDPQYAPAWNNKAMALSAVGKKEEALAAYEKAIDFDPKNAVSWRNKGNVLLHLGKNEEGLAAFEKAIDLKPTYAAAWNAKGHALIIFGKKDQALAAFEKAVDLDPKDAVAWYNKGVALSRLGKIDQALAAYEKAVDLNPNYASAWINKGNVLSTLGKEKEALEAHEKAITIEPQYAGAWFNKGLSHKNLGEKDKALVAYQKAIEFDPTFAKAWYFIGLYFDDAGEKKAAAESFHKALDYSLPDHLASLAKLRLKMIEAGPLPDRPADDKLLSDILQRMESSKLLERVEDSRRNQKNAFQEAIARETLLGQEKYKNTFFVLRDWNSYTPLLPLKYRPASETGPADRWGGGYFLSWMGHGVAIDPGLNFIEQLYEHGLSIADVNSVIVTHVHLDHTRDIESLIDLNYRHNKSKLKKPRKDDFRQLKFFLCKSAFHKYGPLLKLSGCCENPAILFGDEAEIVLPTPPGIADGIRLKSVRAYHQDIFGEGDAIGLLFDLRDEHGKTAVRLGLTSDTRWNSELPKKFADCDVLVAHLGTTEIAAGQIPELLDNHLGVVGMVHMVRETRPKVFVVGEFGEELLHARDLIVRILMDYRVPESRPKILAGDSNLKIKLHPEIGVFCNHTDCASGGIISYDKVDPVLGDDFLFRYWCDKHYLR
jgi:tetratricopeptide (TPR) repeat protein